MAPQFLAVRPMSGLGAGRSGLRAPILWLKEPALGKGLECWREGACQGPREWQPPGMVLPRYPDPGCLSCQSPSYAKICGEPGLIPRP